MIVNFMKLHKDAVVPTYATDGAACFDIYACELTSLFGEKDPSGVLISTGIAVEIPEGHCMKIYSRSGHGFKNSVRLANCVAVIDSDYRGEIKIALIKDNDAAPGVEIKAGSRIAQGMIEKVEQVHFHEVMKLNNTNRGIGGFGSTDK